MQACSIITSIRRVILTVLLHVVCAIVTISLIRAHSTNSKVNLELNYYCVHDFDVICLTLLDKSFCVNCTQNTYGDNCEKCAPNAYFNAVNKMCVSCDCDPYGVLNQTNMCDQVHLKDFILTSFPIF